MKKEEFIKELKEKLDILEKNEIEDIISEYTGYIEEKIQNGKSEEEAIKDFGDIDELTTELLKAYKINVEKNKPDKNIWSNIVDKFSNWMDNIIEIIEEKNSKDVIKMIFEIAIIILGICLCKIPFHMLEQIGYNVFKTFQNAFGLGLFRIWRFIIEFAYLIFAIVLFAKIFEKRYLSNRVKIKNEETQKSKKKTSKKLEKTEPEVFEKDNRKSLLDYLASMCLYFIKFIVFWILLGIGFYILGLGMCLGICIYLLIRGITYIGVYLSIFFLLIIGVFAFIWLFNWILDRKNNVRFLLIGFIITFIGLGLSFSYASIEVATTEFMNLIPEDFETKEVFKSISVTGNEILLGNYKYEVDETLSNEIKIKYTYYPEYFEFEPEIEYETQSRIYINSYHLNNIWNGKILENVIKDLKERKIHNYDLSPKTTIYANSEMMTKLRSNKKNWNEQRNNYSLYNYCKKEQREGNELSNTCLELLNIEE